MRIDTLIIVIAVACLIFGVGGIKSCHDERKELKQIEKGYTEAQGVIDSLQEGIIALRAEKALWQSEKDTLLRLYAKSDTVIKIRNNYVKDYSFINTADSGDIVRFWTGYFDSIPF